jgi:hypothetical protein
MKKLIYISMLAAALLAACGPKATPTMSPADVQSTAFAAASTMVAMTEAAIPTATPVPPTETPTETPLPSPTLPPPPTSSLPTVAPTNAGNTGADDCNHYLSNPAGRPTTIKVANATKGSLVFSIFLSKTPFGECGYRGYNIGKGDSIIISDLVQGCYSVQAYVNDPKKPSTALGGGCINNDDKWTFTVGTEVIKLSPP